MALSFADFWYFWEEDFVVEHEEGLIQSIYNFKGEIWPTDEFHV